LLAYMRKLTGLKRSDFWSMILIIFIAGAAFYLSFDGLRNHAEKYGLGTHYRHFLFPLLLDAMLVVAGLKWFNLAKKGFPTWPAMVLVLMGTVLSIFYNCYSSPPPEGSGTLQVWVNWSTHAIAPIILFAMTKILVWEQLVKLEQAKEEGEEEIDHRALLDPPRMEAVEALDDKTNNPIAVALNNKKVSLSERPAPHKKGARRGTAKQLQRRDERIKELKEEGLSVREIEGILHDEGYDKHVGTSRQTIVNVLKQPKRRCGAQLEGLEARISSRQAA